MAYNIALEQKLDALTAKRDGISKKKMFGGVAFLIHGNMSVGVQKDVMMMRVAHADEAAWLEKPHIRPMYFTGKRMKGWLTVEPDGWDDDRLLPDLVKNSCDFAATLPKKAGK
jgi:TfoX/Sxy family transcriptional regulator of competence genes